MLWEHLLVGSTPAFPTTWWCESAGVDFRLWTETGGFDSRTSPQLFSVAEQDVAAEGSPIRGRPT